MVNEDCFNTLRFSYHPKRQEEFRSGGLGRVWMTRYPALFDDEDRRLYGTQGDTYHFFEWLAAVLIYESTGYQSLIEKYDCHAGKFVTFRRVVGDKHRGLGL